MTFNITTQEAKEVLIRIFSRIYGVPEDGIKIHFTDLLEAENSEPKGYKWEGLWRTTIGDIILIKENTVTYLLSTDTESLTPIPNIQVSKDGETHAYGKLVENLNNSESYSRYKGKLPK